MRRTVLRQFLRCLRLHQPLYEDAELALHPREYHKIPYTLDDCAVLIFDLCVSGKTAGEIALRIGEGDALYYLGHIGYHVDKNYQGHHYAEKACRLVEPVFLSYGMRSWVITTDCDNLPSIRTCKRLGCIHESTVRVPEWCRRRYGLGFQKERFVYVCNPAEKAV